jgi:hypothetical protein
VLKKNIKYEDFNGETVEETFYFNMSQTEVITLQLDYDGGMEAFINRIIKAENIKSLIAEFQKIVLMSYGQKSEDGKRFIKSDQLREEFSQTAAYNALFMELAIDADAAAEFIMGIIPKGMAQDVNTKTVSTLPDLPADIPQAAQPVSWTSPAEPIPQPPQSPTKE